MIFSVAGYQFRPFDCKDSVASPDSVDCKKGRWEESSERNLCNAGRCCWSILEKAGMQAQEMPMKISKSLAWHRSLDACVFENSMEMDLREESDGHEIPGDVRGALIDNTVVDAES